MVTFLLLAVLLLVWQPRQPARQTARFLAAIPLALSAFVKLITLPLAGVYLLGELRLKRWRSFFIASLLFGLTALGVNLLFSRDLRLWFGFMSLLGQGGDTAGEALPGLIPNLLRLGFGLLLLAAAWYQDGRPRRLLRSWAVLLLYFSLFIGDFHFAHYLITLIAVVALVLNWPLAVVTLALSFASFTIHQWQSLFNQVFPAPELRTPPAYLLYIGVGALAILGIIAVSAWRRRQRQAAIS